MSKAMDIIDNKILALKGSKQRYEKELKKVNDDLKVCEEVKAKLAAKEAEEPTCSECGGNNMTDDPDEERCVECIQASAEALGDLEQDR